MKIRRTIRRQLTFATSFLFFSIFMFFMSITFKIDSARAEFVNTLIIVSLVIGIAIFIIAYITKKNSLCSKNADIEENDERIQEISRNTGNTTFKLSLFFLVLVFLSSLFIEFNAYGGLFCILAFMLIIYIIVLLYNNKKY